LKGVEDIDGVRQSCSVNYPKRAHLVLDSDFLNAFANIGHGLEIIRLIAALQVSQLTARIAACLIGKTANALKGIGKESDWFHTYFISEQI
jgi:hypothetical protein